MPKPDLKKLFSHIERFSKAPQIHAMITMAKSEPGMTRRFSEFDADPMMPGVANGVIDLQTQTLLPVSPNVLVTKRCNVSYDPSAECPRFEKFLQEVQPDDEMRKFLQDLMGYCLMGQVGENIFAFLWGHGSNGKSVFVELMAWVLGDYAHKIAIEMLMRQQRNSQGPSADIMSLKGRRFVYANETAEGARLDEARVKDMTGGDTLTGRVPYGKADINFSPSHKLFIVGNHKPDISDTSEGMWRRPVLIPFNQKIPEPKQDLQLLETLKSEGPGILNWMLEGLRDWLNGGLKVPDSVKADTAAYREEQDILGDWIGDQCLAGPGCSVAKAELYNNYKLWTDDNGHRPMSQTKLTRNIEKF